MIPLGPTSLASVGQSRSLGCQSCFLLDLCGGVYSDWNCEAECCGKPDKCTTACFQSKRFVEVVHDAGGFEINQRWNIGQKRTKLPTYIPHIFHGYRRSTHLAAHTVALTTYDVLRGFNGGSRQVSTPEELRKKFKISPDARVILLSVGKDHRLERYWEHQDSHKLAERLAALGITYVTAPNYSFPLNVPRPEHLVNRRRTLVSAERLSSAGLSVIPHLNAVTQTDWECWRDFLRDHPQLFYVSLEFQTGLCTVRKAKWHLAQFMNLQEALGRNLHLIAIAGRRHIRFLSELPSVSIVDAVPFVKTHKRRRIQFLNNKWDVRKSEPGESLDQLLQENVDDYKKVVMKKLHDCRIENLTLLSAQDGIKFVQIEAALPAVLIDPQLTFPFWADKRIADRRERFLETVSA
jgi:Domain of unknown function (DUF4417)